MAKLDENDTVIPLPESMLPDFGTGRIVFNPTYPSRVPGKADLGYFISPPTCFLCSSEQREEFISMLETRVAKLVVSMTTGTCKCGKTPDACCQNVK